jgi:transcriptional regulator GlxA family with amidase domain
MSDASPQINVAILAVPEVTASTTYAMYDLFAGAGRDWAFITTGVAGVSRMRPYIVAAQKAPVLSANGIGIMPDFTLDDCPEPAIVCIPDFSLFPGANCAGSFDLEVAWLRRCHAAGATLASVCTSTSLLAATGLLDGLDATIHWAYTTAITRHYPTVRVHPDRALVVSGIGQRIVMAGGGTSHLDLVLYLIGRFVSLKEALEVSKAYLINWHDTGQQPFATLHGSQHSSDGLIAKCQAWIAEHYAEPSPVGAMTKLSGYRIAHSSAASSMPLGCRPWIMSMRFGLRRPSRYWKLRTYRSKQLRSRLVTRTPASSAASSAAKLALPRRSTDFDSDLCDGPCSLQRNRQLKHRAVGGDCFVDAK